MTFDLVYLVLMVLAIWNGYRKGLVVGVFSLVAVIIGLAAAMKLSVAVSHLVGDAVKVSEEWLPIISFLLVFIVVILLIRLGAHAIEKTLQIAMLGWLNRLGGTILYLAIYTIVFSILVFYAEQVGFLRPEKMDSSLTYSFVQPWGPKVINGLASIIPWFREMFEELKQFFGRVETRLN